MGSNSFIRGIKFTKSLLKKDTPKYACIQLTGRCNMSCSFCSFWSSDAKVQDELTVADYERLSKEFSEFGFMLTTLEGGEPLFRNDVVDIVKAFAKHHLVVMYTNGSLVTPQLAKDLFAAGLHRIGVSLDYPDAKRHDAKRGVDGAFQGAINALTYLRDAAPHKGNQVSVLTVLMKDNQNEIENLLKMTQELKVGFDINLLSTNGIHRSDDPHNQLPDSEIAEKLLTLWKKYPNFQSFRQYLRTVENFVTKKDLPQCRAGQMSFNVGFTGEISSCIEKTNQSFGNVKTEAFSKIFARLKEAKPSKNCQCCWTLCRGFGQVMGDRSNVQGWMDMITRMNAN